MDFLSFLVATIVNTFISLFFFYLMFNYMRNKILAQLEEELNDSVVRAYLEFTEGSIMMYDKEDNSFIAQGRDWEELNKNVTTRYPNVSFDIDHESAEKAMRFNK